MTRATLSDDDYRRLLAFRHGLRRFLHWSEQQAEAAGLTPAQHQLLLAIRGHDGDSGPTVGQLADYLLVRHHSVVGLIDRAEQAGLVKRGEDRTDRRVVHIRLAPAGERALARLSTAHLQEISRVAESLAELAASAPDG